HRPSIPNPSPEIYSNGKTRDNCSDHTRTRTRCGGRLLRDTMASAHWQTSSHPHDSGKLEDRHLCLEEAQHHRCDGVEGTYGEQTMARSRKAAKTSKEVTPTAAQDKRLYTLDVFLVGGPLADAFVEQNPVVSRTIDMRANQTLAELHGAIFTAFDRQEQHLYEFQIGGQGPQDPNATCYGLPMARQNTYGGAKPAGDVTRTRLGLLGLKVGDVFGYWFDFGDDWWHQINVVDIQPEAPLGTYPRVTKRVGASPPQY